MMTTRRELIEDLRTVFQSWEKVLAEASESEITAPLRPGAWSIAEVVTHLCAWQQISIAHVEAVLANSDPRFPAWLDGADPFYAEDHVDVFNARIQEDWRSESWPQRHTEWRDGFLRFLALADAVPDSVLFDTKRCPWLRGYALAAVLEGSCEHHRHHLDRVRAAPGDDSRGT